MPSHLYFGRARRFSGVLTTSVQELGDGLCNAIALLSLIPKGVFSAATRARLLLWFAFAEGGSKALLLLEVFVPPDSSGARVQRGTGQD